MVLKTIDAHVSGTTVRLIVDGFPAPRGATLREKRAWVARHADQLRRVALLEPRGHPGMIGAVLVEPPSFTAHAGILFLDPAGDRALSYEAVVAAAAIALERRILVPGDVESVVFEAAPGALRLTVDASTGEVACQGVPSFALAGAIEATSAGRPIRADLAYAGELVAIVDSESAGVPLATSHLPELSRAGQAIAESLGGPADVLARQAGLSEGLSGTVFTGPAQSGEADLRTVVVRRDGTVERTPSGCALAAVLCVLDAMGVFDDSGALTTESLMGTTLTGRIGRRTAVGERAAIVPEIHGRAWIVGEHVLFADERDPLRAGLAPG